MNKEQILQEQIVELNKLLELKDKRIAELERYKNYSPWYPYQNPWGQHWYTWNTNGTNQTIQGTTTTQNVMGGTNFKLFTTQVDNGS